MPDLNLQELKAEYETLTNQLTDPELISNWEKFQELSKKRASLEKIVKKAQELEQIQLNIEENTQILVSEEPELSSLAEAELQTLREKELQCKEELNKLLKGETESPKAIIVEIRAGTGGEEASLFARNLFDMYQKYAVLKQWETTILNTSETEVGGLREASLEIKGEQAYALLRNEAGVHRVQRVPTTEKAGRIHTSTATVAVLAKATKTQIALNPADLTIEFTGASGPGGQNVNKRQTAVRITYVPTGLVVLTQSSRSQQKNREAALSLLESRILQQQKETEQKAQAGARKAQVGTAERSEKIRTYNFPQDRITDHRITKSWHGIEKILEGDLNPIVEALKNLPS